MSHDRVQVLLVDDQTALREVLAYALEREPDIAVTGHVGTIAEARRCLARSPVDVAVTELDLPDGSGVELIDDLRRLRPLMQVLILTATADRYDLGDAVEAGAAGVLHKSAPLEEIVTAVRRLCTGQPVMEPTELVRLLHLAEEHRSDRQSAQAALARLTPREHDVLVALAHGLSDKEIAQQLHVSHETVCAHMVRMHRKLGVESRLQALIFAVKHGVVRLARSDLTT